MTVFADDIAVALGNVFRDLHVLRRFMGVVRAGIGLSLNPDESAVINCTRRPHLVVWDVSRGGSGFPVSAAGRYLGCVLGSGSFATHWAAVQVKFLAHATHANPLRLHSLGIPLAYNTLTISVVTYTAQLLPLDASVQAVEHMALARIFSTTTNARSPHMSIEVGTLGAHAALQDLRRMAWEYRCEHRLDRAPQLVFRRHTDVVRRRRERPLVERQLWRPLHRRRLRSLLRRLLRRRGPRAVVHGRRLLVVLRRVVCACERRRTSATVIALDTAIQATVCDGDSDRRGSSYATTYDANACRSCVLRNLSGGGWGKKATGANLREMQRVRHDGDDATTTDASEAGAAATRSQGEARSHGSLR